MDKIQESFALDHFLQPFLGPGPINVQQPLKTLRDFVSLSIPPSFIIGAERYRIIPDPLDHFANFLQLVFAFYGFHNGLSEFHKSLPSSTPPKTLREPLDELRSPEAASAEYSESLPFT